VNHEEQAKRDTDLVAQIYCDIFRPVTDTKLPALLAVSPYGKNGHGMSPTSAQ
jgi:predicted acyl esterase